MGFAFWPAFIAGVVGGASMVAMRMLLQVAGVDLTFDPARLWGTMVLAHGTAAQVLGMLIHLFLIGHLLYGLVVGLVYAALHPSGGWHAII